MGYGIITLLPALLVIVVAIKSKRTTEALLIGCVSSYLIIATANKSNPVTLMVDSFFKVVTDYDTVWLLIVCGLFGSLIAVINAARGTHAIANFLGKICKTDKSTLLTSWILGIIIFVDDYMNIMTISMSLILQEHRYVFYYHFQHGQFSLQEFFGSSPRL